MKDRLTYTGVGSRQTPRHIQSLMTTIARRLQEMSLICRTGDAFGADRAFYNGSVMTAEVYRARDILENRFGNSYEALDLAESIHPAWDRMGEYAQALHARNCYQVLGPQLNDPSEFLICWTSNGEPVGGTRTAIMLAQMQRSKVPVPVFNFGHPDGLAHLTGFVKSQQWYVPQVI